MSTRNGDELPVRHRPDDLEELEPHQRTIERAAEIYYGACDRMARTIRTLKEYLGSSDGDE